LQRRILYVSLLITLFVILSKTAFCQGLSKDTRKARELQLEELRASINNAAREPVRTFKTKEGYLRFLGSPPSTHFAVEPAKRGTARQAADAFLQQWRNLLVKENLDIATRKFTKYVRFCLTEAEVLL